MATKTVARPDFVADEHLEYLDKVRESGSVNMFGARPLLMRKFASLDHKKAGATLVYWMESFGERHPK